MFEDLTLLSMAQKSMDWLSRRQEVLSQNIANANTPKYQAKDLSPLSFKHLMQAQPQPIRAVADQPMHISPEPDPNLSRRDLVTERRPEESKPNGNSVLIEEQMQKVGDVKSQYGLAVNIFMKNISMLKTAIGKGG